MTAGLYASRARLKTVLVEKLSCGGQVLTTHWVDNYPGFPEGISGFELVDRMRKQAERFDLEIATEEVVSLSREQGLLRLELATGSLMTARSLIIASGAQPTKLGVPGEIEMTGHGVSYCATCDGPFYRNAVVAVVGGGDTAVEEALFLTRFASEVHLFHRRDELRATGILREKALADPKIRIHWSSALKEIKADDQNQVESITYTDLKSGRSDVIQVEGVFMFVGQRPITVFAQGFVEMDQAGFIITDADMATTQDGVWAAGDVRAKKFRQISTAVGEGAVAAYMAEKYLEK
jgi:thioredoxin reductase (NADPH)